jgi:hypothetical protein
MPGIGERIKERIGRKTIRPRNKPGKMLQKRVPSFAQSNFGEGTVAGAVTAGVAVVLEDVIGVPFGADTDVVDVEQDGTDLIYVVDVNAPAANMAQARAFMDATTGFTSYIMEEYDVQDAEVVAVRPLRDTYRVRVRVAGTDIEV